MTGLVIGAILILHAEGDRLAVRRQRHMTQRQRFHVGRQDVALQHRARARIELEDRAFDLAGIDRWALHVGGTRNAADGNHEHFAAACEQHVVRFDAGSEIARAEQSCAHRASTTAPSPVCSSISVVNEVRPRRLSRHDRQSDDRRSDGTSARRVRRFRIEHRQRTCQDGVRSGSRRRIAHQNRRVCARRQRKAASPLRTAARRHRSHRRAQP